MGNFFNSQGKRKLECDDNEEIRELKRMLAEKEERLKELFENGQVENPEIYEAWKKSKKKSDMADALCMTVDYQK